MEPATALQARTPQPSGDRQQCARYEGLLAAGRAQMKVRQVLRALMRREDTSPIPLGGLLTTRTARDGWQDWLAQALAEADAQTLLARHPRADALQDGFSVGAYLALNNDVADAIQTPIQAVFHYIEFGIPEGRNGTADTWNPSFVSQVHGISLPPHLSAPDVACALAGLGIPPQNITLCERDLWLSLGLYGPSLTHIFHHEAYLAAVDVAGLPLPAPDRLSCLRHFAQTGLDAGLPAHPDHTLDPAFYSASLAAIPLQGTPSLRHWARIGLRHGAPANAQAAAQTAYGIHLPASVPLRSAKHLADVISRPEQFTRTLDASSPEIRRFLVDLAHLKRDQGDAASAEMLLTHALKSAPKDPRAALELADLIHGSSKITREIALREIPPANFDSGSNRVTLAELSLRQADFAKALTYASTLPASAQSDVALRRRAHAVGRAVFDTLWTDLPKHLADLGLPKVQSLLAEALTLYAPPPDLLPRSGAITRVAILANDDLYQCKLYRADQKADQLRAHGLHVRTYLQSRDLAALHADLAQFDAVIFQRTPAFPHIVDIMVDAARQGLTTFYDIDDLIFDADVFPPPLATYAGQIDKAQHDAIACGVPLFAASARLCEVGIASTDPIRAALAPLTRSGTAFTHENALGSAHMAAMRSAAPRANDKVVIFYGSGTKAHKAEFRDILEPALAHVLQARPGQVEIRLMGDFPDLAHLRADDLDVTVIAPIWDFECYASVLRQADIALSVLSPSASADAKSALKWSEPAMFAIPAIVSPTSVMTAVIKDGITGLIAADTYAFATALLHLIDDPDQRRAMGQAAQTQILHEYALPKMGAALATQMSARRTPAKTKLLVANVFYPPQDIGGATRVVADNVAHLTAHYPDFEIDVLTTLNGGTTAHEVQAVSHSGVRIWAITAADHVIERAMTDPVMDARVEALLDRLTPDIVHIHCVQRMGAGLIDACRRRGIPYVLTLHDGWWISPNQFLLNAEGVSETVDFNDTSGPMPERAQIARRCITDASACLAVSEPFAQLHRDLGLSNVQALSNGVSSLPTRILQPGPPGRVRLGLIGGASRHKGYDILRAALTSHAFKNLDLLIVDNALPPGTQAQEIWNTTPVLRIPRLSQAQVGALDGRFDVLMAPSVWPESFGLVAREALALGLWVVASDRGAMAADITEGINGHVVPVEDHRALAEVLSRIDADTSRYTTAPPAPSLRTAAQQGDDLAALYKQILKK